MSDLLADLQVDRDRSVPAATPAVRPAAPVPALAVRVTPLHWSRPAVRLVRSGWCATGGPLHVELALR